MKVKYIKNVTQNLISILGYDIPAGAQQHISIQKWGKAAKDSGLLSLIQSGDIVVSNGTNELSVEDAEFFISDLSNVDIEDLSTKIKRRHFIQFSFTEDMDYDQYLVSYADSDTNTNRLKRSGNSSNGFRYGNCAPTLIPFSGKIKSARLIMKGGAVDGANIDSIVTANFELFSVGFQNEGVKIDDLIFSIDSSTYTIGQWWNSSVDSNINILEDKDIPISGGNMLGLKFNSIRSSEDIVKCQGVLILLEIEEI